MFLKVQKNSPALKQFLSSLSTNDNILTPYIKLDYFICDFRNSLISFDNLSQQALTRLIQDGRVGSWIFEEWIQENTNLTRINGQKRFDFVDDEGVKYQQKMFTKNGCKLLPSDQQGIGRCFNKIDYENYLMSQWFIIIGIKMFPIVHVKIFHGKILLERYPEGVITTGKYKSFFV